MLCVKKVRVVPDRLTKSRKVPTRKDLPLCFMRRTAAGMLTAHTIDDASRAEVDYALWAVQLRTNGGQFDFACSSTRTEGPHGDAPYVEVGG